MVRDAARELIKSVVFTVGWPVGRLLHKVDGWLRTTRVGLLAGVTDGYTTDDAPWRRDAL